MNDDEEFMDTRTREQRIGAIPGNTKRRVEKITLSTSGKLAKIPDKDLHLAEKAIRSQVNSMIMELTPQVVLNLFDIAMHGHSESARVDASKVFIQSTVGRPSTVHVGANGHQVMPNFTIVFGDSPTVTQLDSVEFETIDDVEND